MEYRFTPILFLLIFCCSSDEQIVENLNYNTIVNLHAPANGGQGDSTDGNFTKFDLKISEKDIKKYKLSKKIVTKRQSQGPQTTN